MLGAIFFYKKVLTNIPEYVIIFKHDLEHLIIAHKKESKGHLVIKSKGLTLSSLEK